MPLPDRTLAPTLGVGESADLRERALAVLTAAELAHVVDLVGYADGDCIVATNAAGAVRYRSAAPHDVISTTGRDPLAADDPLAFTPLDAEPPAPRHADNVYPFGRERLADLFADPRAPDLVVVHSAGHHWPERGGHLGEHGSLDAVQSRAPLLLSGAGVSGRGVLDRTARLRDVGPLLARLAGCEWRPTGLDDLVTPGARHVVGLLWDGVNCNDLIHLATTGELPAVARLLERGCVLRGGAIAEFPSVTLTNHTSALTGVGPGTHGILNNAFYDVAAGVSIVPNDSSTWHRACEWLRPGVPTLFEVVSATRPDARTACVNEPVDRGAGYSTFGLVRDSGQADGAKGLGSSLPDPTLDPHASQDWVAASKDYHWGSAVDGLGLQQVLALWSDAGSRPDVMWWNTTLTDSAHHDGGPHSDVARASLRDADRRLGVFLDLLDRAGLTDDTAIVLTSDHGMELADPTCTGDWDEALRAAGIPFRDEAYGFLYLGVGAAG